MARESLEQLLHEADAFAQSAASAGPAELAARVRRMRNRRNAGRIAGLALAGCVAIAGGLMFLSRWYRVPAPTFQPIAQANPGALRAELAALRREADERTAHVEMLLAVERRVASRHHAPRGDPLERLRAEQDRAALILIHQADRYSRELKLKAPAADGYRRVIELFPESQWASLARQRLSEIESRSLRGPGAPIERGWTNAADI